MPKVEEGVGTSSVNFIDYNRWWRDFESHGKVGEVMLLTVYSHA